MDKLAIVTNFELDLKSGNSVILYNPDSFDVALIECKKNRTHITLFDEGDNPNDSTVMKALKDENIPTFSVDTSVLEEIINRSSEIIGELITLLAYHQDISQKNVDAMMEKICNLSKVYSVEYIVTEIGNMSEIDFNSFIETDDTFVFFKNYVEYR